MPEFIRREEFSAEVRNLREDIKDVGGEIKEGIATVLGELKDTHKEVELVKTKQAIQERAIDALEDMPQLESIRDVMEQGFRGVNARLDKVNGRLDSNTAKIGEHEGKIDILVGKGPSDTDAGEGGMSRKAKVAVAGVGGVSLLAVLHSLFEMLRALAPEIAKLFGK